MKFDELNKINNFIYFLEDEKLWENFNISYYDMLETNSENFFNEINNNVFGKSKLEKNDIISQFVFELYNNMVILDNFKKNNPKYNSTEYKFLSEIYESSINSIVYVCFKNGFDFVQIILNLKLRLSLFNLEKYNEMKEFMFDYEDNQNVDEPSPHIFKNPDVLELFMHFYEMYQPKNTYLSDISFIYRIMYQEKLIKSFCKPEIFRNWLSENKLLNTKSSISQNHKLHLDRRYLHYSEVRDRILNS